jgi:hypothetical protein
LKTQTKFDFNQAKKIVSYARYIQEIKLTEIFQANIVDLTIDSGDESGQSISDEFKLAYGKVDGKQDSEYLRNQILGLLTGDPPASALLDSLDGNNALINLLQATAKDSMEKSTRRRAHQPRLHGLVNDDMRTNSNDSDDDIIEFKTTKRPSNSSKRSLRAADDEDQAISHKRRKVDKDATLLDNQVDSPQDAKTSGDESKVQSKRKTRPKFRGHSLKSHIDNEFGWLDAASLGCTKLWERSVRNTRHLSDLIELEDESAKLLADIAENMTPQTRKSITQFLKVEEKRRNQTLQLFRNGVSDLSECESMKEVLGQWALEDRKVSKLIEKSR